MSAWWTTGVLGAAGYVSYWSACWAFGVWGPLGMNVIEPKTNSLVAGLNSVQEGYAASRSHIESNAIKTNCSMAGCIRIAKQLQQCSSAE